MIVNQLSKKILEIKTRKDLQVTGKILKITGLMIEAKGISAPIGYVCLAKNSDGEEIEVEVVGFSNDTLYLMPISRVTGFCAGATIVSTDKPLCAPVSEALLGRIIDGSGKPIDSLGPILTNEYRSLHQIPVNPLSRQLISEPLDVGIRAINALYTIGIGQRIGLIAGSGVGKSVLLGMISRFTSAEVVIVCLIGERSREIREFIDRNLGKEGLKKSCVIVAPADCTPVQRVNAALMATTISEYFRDKNKKVLLMMDSLTRYAQALREIGLSLGEVPATKGYPPSVFAKIPELVERVGFGGNTQGSISAIYTVLAEGDDPQEPIVDAARSILDGHIVLSRKLSESGHYPAIDVEQSLSRVMQDIVQPPHFKAFKKLKQLYSKYEKYKDLIMIGAYTPGNDPDLDDAIKLLPEINLFLQQEIKQKFNFQDSVSKLIQLLG